MTLCECGCGQPAPLAPKTIKQQGYRKGEPQRYIRGHFRWPQTVYGYEQRSHNGRNIRAHVLIAETVLGHPLPRGAQVHHVDENKQNNAHRNLVICQDAAYHDLLHYRATIVRAGGNPNREALCSVCRLVKPVEAFRPDRTNVRGHRSACRACHQAQQRELYRRHREDGTWVRR
jgi:HNH endonuclease